MTLVDRTNETIPLSLEEGVSVLRDVHSPLSGYTVEPASLAIDVDFESDRDPVDIIWFMFFAREDEPWYKLTYEEAEKVYDRLGRCLGKVTNDE